MDDEEIKQSKEAIERASDSNNKTNNSKAMFHSLFV